MQVPPEVPSQHGSSRYSGQSPTSQRTPAPQDLGQLLHLGSVHSSIGNESSSASLEDGLAPVPEVLADDRSPSELSLAPGSTVEMTHSRTSSMAAGAFDVGAEDRSRRSSHARTVSVDTSMLQRSWVRSDAGEPHARHRSIDAAAPPLAEDAAGDVPRSAFSSRLASSRHASASASQGSSQEGTGPAPPPAGRSPLSNRVAAAAAQGAEASEARASAPLLGHSAGAGGARAGHARRGAAEPYASMQLAWQNLTVSIAKRDGAPASADSWQLPRVCLWLKALCSSVCGSAITQPARCTPPVEAPSPESRPLLAAHSFCCRHAPPDSHQCVRQHAAHGRHSHRRADVTGHPRAQRCG